MTHTLQASLSAIVSLSGLSYLTAGIAFGLIVGVLPGLGGMFALSMILPVIIGLDPNHALALLIGAYASTPAGGAITAILLGVPGTVGSAATVIDGFVIAKQGKAGEAIGAALAASAIGGVIGALVLLLMVPVLSKVVLAFGPAEMVMLTLLGVSFVGTLGGKGGTIKAWISGALGLFLATVRMDMVTGVERFTFGIVELWDGLSLVAAVLGLFAVCEMIELSRSESDYYSGTKLNTSALQGMWGGVKTTFSKLSLVARCSGLGTLVGMIPGLGGETAIFIAYAYAAQASRDPKRFGQGEIEGVIAPESANHAKEGGALIPTIGLGVPGSGMMAIFLGAFMMMGLYPGPGMLLKAPGTVFFIIWALVLGSILSSIIAFAIASPLIRLVYSLKTTWLAPSVVVLAAYGVYISRGSLVDLLVLFSFGLLGVFMNAFHFSRAALLVGFVLGNLLEKNIQQAYGVYGWTFFMQPLSLVILLVVIAGMLLPLLMKRGQERVAPMHGERKISLIFIGFFLIVGLYSFSFGMPSAIAPVVISSLGLTAGIFYFVKAQPRPADEKPIEKKAMSTAFALFVLLFLIVTKLAGLYVSAVLFMMSFLIWVKKERFFVTLAVTGSVIGLIYAIGLAFSVALPKGSLINISSLL